MKRDDGTADGASARTTRSVYDRGFLLSLNTPLVSPSSAVVECVRSLGLWTVCRMRRTCRGLRINRYRGRRSGRTRRLLPWQRPISNGAIIIVGNRPPPVRRPPRPLSVRRVHLHRRVTPKGPALVFGCHNIRSLVNKLDNLLDVRRDLDIDVLFLVETWHDADAVRFRRLRTDGFQVIDRPRPRLHNNTLSTNYGGVAAVAVSGFNCQR